LFWAHRTTGQLPGQRGRLQLRQAATCSGPSMPRVVFPLDAFLTLLLFPFGAPQGTTTPIIFRHRLMVEFAA